MPNRLGPLSFGGARNHRRHRKRPEALVLSAGTNPVSTTTCPKCGSERPAGDALVLCPKCLLAEGVAGAEMLTGSGEQTLAVPAANVVLAPGQLPFRALG